MENALICAKDVSDLERIGKAFETSGMFGCAAQGQGLVLAMTCMTERISPLQFINTYHIIDGKPSMRADAMLAKFVERGGKYKVVARTSEEAKAVFEKDGNKLEASLTWDDAQKEPFVYGKKDMQGNRKVKDNWATPRNRMQMLWARIVSDSIRVLDPAVNHGRYTPEEVQDFDDEPEMKRVKTEPYEPPKSAEALQTAAAKTGAESKAIVPEVLPPEKAIDFTIVPVGKSKGKKWAELNTVALEAAKQVKHPDIKPGHIEEIEKILTERAKSNGK